MNDVSRLNRPTYATPKKLKRGRMIHQSTNFTTIRLPNGLERVVFPKGNTYRRPK